MAIRTYKVTLDTKNAIAPEPVYLRQGDKTGAVVIDATLMDNGSPVSLDGLTPMFKANTADGQAVIADSTGFNIVNAPGGEFTYQVPSQLGSVSGKIKIAYFSFSDSSGAQSTFNVAFVVEKAADMTQESAKDWVSNLNDIISQYNKWVNDAHSSWQDFVNENKEIIESIDPGGTLLTEVIDARNGKSNLKTRLDDEHAQVTEQLAQNVTEKNNRAINVKYPPAPYVGAKADGSDDTAAIQGVIDYLASNGGGVAIIPKGNYYVSSLDLKDRVTLLGTGWYSILKSIDANTSTGIIKMYNNQAIWASVKGLTIDGNKTNQTIAVDGILIDSTSANNDAHLLFQDVYIHDCSGHGLSIPVQSRENRFLNVWSEKNTKDGFNIHGSDNFFGFCTANNNANNGFNFDEAYSNKMTTCKAFANTLDGFIFQNLANLQIENLESQENAKNGFVFKNARFVTGTTLISDTNSTVSAKADVAYLLDNSNHIQINGVATNRYNLLGTGHGYAVRSINGSYCNDIKVMKYGNQKPMGDIDDQAKDVTNKIEINNALFSVRNLQRVYLLDDANADGVSDVFDSVYKCPTGIVGSNKINYAKQAQELSIDSSTSVGDFAFISADKTIPIIAGRYLSLEVITELSAPLTTNGQVKIEWLDGADAVISTEGLYGNSTFLLNKIAPINTMNARVRITFYPNASSATGKMYIKSFKYGIYE